jgi:hypothetical protein
MLYLGARYLNLKADDCRVLRPLELDALLGTVGEIGQLQPQP